MNEERFINNIVYLRKTNGYTQKQLSDLLNYSDKVISKWERGESVPDVSALNKIAHVYKLKIDDLINLDLAKDSLESKENHIGSIKELKLNWVKAPSKFFKSTLLIAIVIYFIGVIAAVLWFEWIMFISVSIGLVLYTTLHQVICHSIVVESDYENHKILVKTTLSKTYLYIDDVLVDKYTSVFEGSFKLSGKLEDQIIKVNMSRVVTTKCFIFVE